MKNFSRHSLRLQLVAALLAAGALAGSARAEGYAGYAGAFLRMGYGAVALGSGDAGVARAIGAEQAHYNPAGLPFAPGNEINVGAHMMSLERRLILSSALYQVPQISFWRGPMRPIYVERPAEGMPMLRYVDETRKQVRPIAVKDYVDALAEAVADRAQTLNDGNAVEQSRITLSLDGDEMLFAGSLGPVVDELAQELNKSGTRTDEAATSLLKRKFLRIQQRPAAVALSWTNAGTGGIDIRDFDGLKSGELGYYENRFALAFGIRLHETVSVGVSAGVLYALVPGLFDDGSSLTSTTFIADLGAQFRPFVGTELAKPLRDLTFGAATYGLGAKNSWNTTGYWSQGTTKNDLYPSRYRIGAATNVDSRVSLFADIETDLDLFAQAKGGVEVRVIDRPFSTLLGGRASGTSHPGLSLRAGLNGSTPTFGFSLASALADLGVTTLDYAILFENAGPGLTQVLNWRFHLRS